MTLVYLSYELSADTPVFGRNSKVRIEVDCDFSTGPYVQHNITTVNHNGSHVDVPRHFHPSGSTLSDFGPECWLFQHVELIDLRVPDNYVVAPHDLADVLAETDYSTDALLIRTGFGECRASDPERYVGANPGFGGAAAEYLRQRFPRLRAVFCDVPSYTPLANVEAGIAWHRKMLDESDDSSFVFLFEDVKLPADLTVPHELWAVPLRLAKLDGAPVTIIASV